MLNSKYSIMSKGWLIIGITIIVIGCSIIFLSNSLFNESNILEEYLNNEDYSEIIQEVVYHLSLNALFLVIASLIIISIGVIMCVEWILFSRFIKKYKEK
jgi:hypothetical protein